QIGKFNRLGTLASRGHARLPESPFGVDYGLSTATIVTDLLAPQHRYRVHCVHPLLAISRSAKATSDDSRLISGFATRISFCNSGTERRRTFFMLFRFVLLRDIPHPLEGR